MLRALLTLVILGGSAWLAAFVAIFCAMTFGTFQLGPDATPGSPWGDAFAVVAGVSVFTIAMVGARSGGLFKRRNRAETVNHG
jgi:hypothetical protein